MLFLAAGGCGGGRNDPSVPAEITLNATAVTLAAAGQTQQLTASVLDENGDPIPDAPVSWSTDDPAIAAVSSSGLVTAQAPGVAVVTVSAGDVDASATVTVQSTASLEVADGNGQTAIAGAPVPTPPAVRVRDGSGNPVSGVRVRFQVGSASGSVTGEIQTTGANGIAQVGSWRLGTSGVNTLTATVEGAEVDGEPAEFFATTAPPAGYDITVRFIGQTPSSSQAEAFAEAELRWESFITGDLTDVGGDIQANQCGSNPATSGPFDDVLIFVSIETIDGEGSVLGQAGPCFIRDAQGDPSVVGDKLPVIGRMLLDVDDLTALEADGSLQAVILHEMGHVLGFGTRWDAFGLLVDPADSDPAVEDPHFIGAAALAAFNAAGGGPYIGQKVPVELVGGVGTINSHWRDEVFDAELMTGFINPGAFNPLSAISVRSLEDMGYTVSVAGADPFTLDLTPIRMAGRQRGRQLINDVIGDPIRKITPAGRVVGMIRR